MTNWHPEGIRRFLSTGVIVREPLRAKATVTAAGDMEIRFLSLEEAAEEEQCNPATVWYTLMPPDPKE